MGPTGICTSVQLLCDERVIIYRQRTVFLMHLANLVHELASSPFNHVETNFHNLVAAVNHGPGNLAKGCNVNRYRTRSNP